MPDIDWEQLRDRIGSTAADIDWGDAPTWTLALFAGLAAVAAWRVLHSLRAQLAEQRTFFESQSAVLDLQRSELHAAARDRRQAQARLVEVTSGVQETAHGLPEGLAAPLRTASVTNSSREPITGVDVRLGQDGPPVRAVERYASGRTSTPPLALLGPRRGVTFYSDRLPAEAPAEDAEAVARFTDHQGVHWQLAESGKLTELEDRQAW